MNRISIIILIIIGICYSCTSLDLQKKQTNDFMPLSIGNKWYYKEFIGDIDQNHDLIKEVISKDTLNGKIYFQIKQTGITRDTTTQSFYFHRLDSDTLFILVYDEIKQVYNESILAVFSLDKDELINFPRDRNVINNIQLRGLAPYIKVIKKNNDKITFSHSLGNDAVYRTYGEGIGLISSSGLGIGGWKLVDYKVK